MQVLGGTMQSVITKEIHMLHNQMSYTVMYWNAVHTGQRRFETLHDMQAFLAKAQSAGYKVQHTPVDREV